MRFLSYIFVLLFAGVCSAVQICGASSCCNKPSNVLSLNMYELEAAQLCLREQEAVLRVRKHSLREHIKQQRLEEQTQKRRLRAQEKCERVRRQIEQLNKRYRQGYNSAQGIRLDRKLADLNAKKQNYCG